MGRTPLSWLLITVFYIIYYTLLAGFWLLCLFIFYQFIEDHQPRWQQDAGLIGKSPALGVRPGQDDSIIESSVIIFNHENPKDDENIPGYKQWVDRLDEYLKPYRAEPAKENGLDCAADAAATDGKFCKFDLTKLGPCGQKNTNYGFDSNSTCLVLKLNKIFGLEHEYYDNPAELPAEMPTELKERIKAAVAGGAAKQVWVSARQSSQLTRRASRALTSSPPREVSKANTSPTRSRMAISLPWWPSGSTRSRRASSSTWSAGPGPRTSTTTGATGSASSGSR